MKDSDGLIIFTVIALIIVAMIIGMTTLIKKSVKAETPKSSINEIKEENAHRKYMEELRKKETDSRREMQQRLRDYKATGR